MPAEAFPEVARVESLLAGPCISSRWEYNLACDWLVCTRCGARCTYDFILHAEAILRHAFSMGTYRRKARA